MQSMLSSAEHLDFRLSEEKIVLNYFSVKWTKKKRYKQKKTKNENLSRNWTMTPRRFDFMDIVPFVVPIYCKLPTKFKFARRKHGPGLIMIVLECEHSLL